MTSPQDKGRKYERHLDKDEVSIPLSGAGRLKEDKKSPEFLTQVKFTTKESYSIKLKDLKELRKNATLVDRSPRFQLAFENGGRLEEFYIIEKKVWEWLTT